MTWENPTLEEAIAVVNQHMHMYHSKTLNDMHITNVRGYWEANEPCNGECRMHGPRKDGLRHTFYCCKPGRDWKGRFLRPYRHWEVIHAATKKVSE